MINQSKCEYWQCPRISHPLLWLLWGGHWCELVWAGVKDYSIGLSNRRAAEAGWTCWWFFPNILMVHEWAVDGNTSTTRAISEILNYSIRVLWLLGFAEALVLSPRNGCWLEWLVWPGRSGDSGPQCRDTAQSVLRLMRGHKMWSVKHYWSVIRISTNTRQCQLQSSCLSSSHLQSWSLRLQVGSCVPAVISWGNQL